MKKILDNNMENEIYNLDLYQGIIKDLSSTINIDNINKLGLNAQKKIEFFTGEINNSICKDNVETSIDIEIPKIIKDLNDFNTFLNKKGGIFKLFSKNNLKEKKIREEFKSLDEHISMSVSILEDEKIKLSSEISLMDEFYKINKDNIKEISLFIKAGGRKLSEIKESISKVRPISFDFKDFEENEDISYLKNTAYRLEKRIYNLNLTLNISLQLSSIIRFMQINRQDLLDKIDSILYYTVPIWKNQILINNGFNKFDSQINLCREIENIASDIFSENTNLLKNESLEIANYTEKSSLNIDKIKEGNKNLIDAFSEVSNIRQRGKMNRKSNENELKQMEQALIEKELSM